jgi:hypothetical protein
MNTCLSILLAVSTHLGLDNNYNDVHPHVRCTIDNWITGAYYNSERNMSYYVGRKISNFEIGLVTGYNSYDVLPMIRYINNGWFVAPAYEKSNNVGLTVGYEFTIK